MDWPCTFGSMAWWQGQLRLYAPDRALLCGPFQVEKLLRDATAIDLPAGPAAADASPPVAPTSAAAVPEPTTAGGETAASEEDDYYRDAFEEGSALLAGGASGTEEVGRPDKESGAFADSGAGEGMADTGMNDETASVGAAGTAGRQALLAESLEMLDASGAATELSGPAALRVGTSEQPAESAASMSMLDLSAAEGRTAELGGMVDEDNASPNAAVGARSTPRPASSPAPPPSSGFTDADELAIPTAEPPPPPPPPARSPSRSALLESPFAALGESVPALSHSPSRTSAALALLRTASPKLPQAPAQATTARPTDLAREPPASPPTPSPTAATGAPSASAAIGTTAPTARASIVAYEVGSDGTAGPATRAAATTAPAPQSDSDIAAMLADVEAALAGARGAVEGAGGLGAGAKVADGAEGTGVVERGEEGDAEEAARRARIAELKEAVRQKTAQVQQLIRIKVGGTGGARLPWRRAERSQRVVVEGPELGRDTSTLQNAPAHPLPNSQVAHLPRSAISSCIQSSLRWRSGEEHTQQTWAHRQM